MIYWCFGLLILFALSICKKSALFDNFRLTERIIILKRYFKVSYLQCDLTVLHTLIKVFKNESIVLVKLIVNVGVSKGKGKDTCVDKVVRVDSCKALCNYCLYAEIKGYEGSMLTGGALSVVGAANYDIGLEFLSACCKVFVTYRKAELGKEGNV